MATTKTLGQLQTDVRQAADMEGSTFVTDVELTSYINASAYELYDVLIQHYGDDYFVAAPSTITTDGTNDAYALPTDFYKLRGVDLRLSASNDSWIPLVQFQFAERNVNQFQNIQGYYGRSNLRYRLRGPNVWFTPMPAGGQTIRLWYVPRWTELALSTDTLDGVSGWTEYVIVDAAIKCLRKEESDPSLLLAQKAALLKRIEEAASNRDAGAPPRVSDTGFREFWGPMGWPSPGGWGPI